MRALALMRGLPASFQRMSEHYLSSSQALTLHSQRSNWASLYLFHKGENTKSLLQSKNVPFVLLRSFSLPDECIQTPSNQSQNARKQQAADVPLDCGCDSHLFSKPKQKKKKK